MKIDINDFKKLTGMSGRSFCRKHRIEYHKFFRALERGYSTLNRNNSSKKHKLYDVYYAIKNRCYNKDNKQYKHYGGRGIRMSGEFFYSFDAFAEYMGKKPGPKYSIDRIDNDGNYERGNLRWATKREQVINRRLSSLNKTGHNNVYKRNGKFRVIVSYSYKNYFGGTYESLENAIASREILKYRLENGMYS